MLVVVFAVFVICYTPQQTLVLYKEWSNKAHEVGSLAVVGNATQNRFTKVLKRENTGPKGS